MLINLFKLTFYKDLSKVVKLLGERADVCELTINVNKVGVVNITVT